MRRISGLNSIQPVRICTVLRTFDAPPSKEPSDPNLLHWAMLDELEFRRHAEVALEELKQHLFEPRGGAGSSFESRSRIACSMSFLKNRPANL